MSDAWFRKAFAAHYPLLYGHRNEAEARQCLELLPRLAPWAGTEAAGPVRVLDLGCGDGRHLQSLVEQGVPALGLDLSPDLLARAKQRTSGSGSLTLVRGDMRGLPFATGSFSAVASLFTAFGYFGPLPQNRSMIAEVARTLRTGGHWFLDYLDCRKVRAELSASGPATRERTIGPMLVRETRSLTGQADRVVKKVEIVAAAGAEAEAVALGIEPDGLEYVEEVALFEVEELDSLASDLGLVRCAAAGDYAGAPLEEGDRWILVFRKEAANPAGESA